MQQFGFVTLILTFLAAIAAAALLFMGARRKKGGEPLKKFGYYAVYAIFGLTTLASLILLYGFIAMKYTFDYVARNSSPDMTVFYRISAFWAGHEGSLLLWLWFVAGAAALIAYFKAREADKLTTYALAVASLMMALMTAFFFIFEKSGGNVVFFYSPFNVAAVSAGQGMNPLLLHWAMVLHPPTLFMGYALMTIPFAYAVAALLAKDASEKWVVLAQRWALVGWLFLSIGIFLGAAWAYVVLGWGGYWGWDPVENASLLPWLGATALLHSFTIYRQRRSFKRWALSMSMFSFLMVIMAAFMTRSGVVQSVHSFEGSAAVIAMFAVWAAVVSGLGGFLLVSRWRDFESEHVFESTWSRDAAYHVNNIVLLFCAAIIVLGAFLPSITGQSLNAKVYSIIAQPLGVALLLLLSLCPLLDFGTTDPVKFVRKAMIPAIIALISAVPWFFCWQYLSNQVKAVSPADMPAGGIVGWLGLIIATFGIVAMIQTYTEKIRLRMRAEGTGFLKSFTSFFTKTPGQAGGLITHLGIATIVIGLIGSSMYVASSQQTIPDQTGTSFTVGGIKFTYRGMSDSTETNKEITRTKFDLTQNGKSLGTMAPAYVYYKLQGQPSMNADVKSQIWPFRDIFFVFQGMNDQKQLVFEVKFNPLIWLVWTGSVILILGILIASLPRRRVTPKR